MKNWTIFKKSNFEKTINFKKSDFSKTNFLDLTFFTIKTRLIFTLLKQIFAKVLISHCFDLKHFIKIKVDILKYIICKIYIR